MSSQTGPTTAAGQATSSVNATTHNGCSEKLIVEGERLEDFYSLVAGFVDHYQPADPHEQSLVEDLAHGRWILWRRRRAFNAVESEIYAIQPNEGKWTEAEFKCIALADRYRTTAERSFNRALKNVEAFSKERVKTFRWEATYDLAVRRLELAKKKHELQVVKAAMKAKKLPPPPQAQRARLRAANQYRNSEYLWAVRVTPRPSCACSSKTPFRSVKSAVSSPVSSASQPFSALNITLKNPEKGAAIA
jgi:hypothetical protein